MSDEQKTGIQKTPVPNRDESGVDLFGWTWPELATMFGVGLGTMIFIGTNWLGFGIMVLTLLWLKKFKDLFPERYLTNMWKHYTRSDRHWRAAKPDTEWRYPVR